MQVIFRAPFQELTDLRCLKRREVVRDPVDLLAARLIDNDVGEENDELHGSMARRGEPRIRVNARERVSVVSA